MDLKNVNSYMPLCYRDAIVEEGRRNFDYIVTGLKLSVAIGDYRKSLFFFLGKLSAWIELKYPVPKEELHSIAKLLYELLCHSVPDSDRMAVLPVLAEVLTSVLHRLRSKTCHKVHSNQAAADPSCHQSQESPLDSVKVGKTGSESPLSATAAPPAPDSVSCTKKPVPKLVFPWRPLYDMILKVCDVFERSGKHCLGAEQEDLMALLQSINRYFEPESATEILAEFEQVATHFTRFDMRIHRAATLLGYFTPRYLPIQSVVPMFERFIGVWGWVEQNFDWNNVWSSLVTRVLQHNPAELKPYAAKFIPVLFTNVYSMVQNALSGNTDQQLSFTSVDALLFSLSNSEGRILYCAGKLVSSCLALWGVAAQDPFSRMMHSLSTFYQPIPAEEDPKSLLPFLGIIVKNYINWIQRDDTITTQEKDFFVDTVLKEALMPMIFVHHQPHHVAPVRLLVNLSVLCPHIVIPPFLQRILPVIRNTPTIVMRPPHYLCCVIEALAGMLPYLLKWPGGMQLLPEFLSAALDAITANDTALTNAALKFLTRFATYLPLVCLESPPLPNKLRKSSSGETPQSRLSHMLPSLTGEIIDRFLKLIQVQDDISSGSKDRKPEENTFVIMFHDFFQQLFMHLSPPLFAAAIHKLCDVIKTTFLPPSSWKLASVLFYSAVHANPPYALKQLVPILLSRLIGPVSPGSHAALLDDLSEHEAQWYLLLFAKTLALSGSHMLTYKDVILDILCSSQKHNRKKVRQMGAKATKDILLALTSIYPAELRALPPKQWEISMTACSVSGICPIFGSKDYSVVDCQWHEPSEEEFAFAAKIVDVLSQMSFEVLHAAMTDTLQAPPVLKCAGESETTPSDLICSALYLLQFILSGVITALRPIADLPPRDGPLAPDGQFMYRNLIVTSSSRTLPSPIRRNLGLLLHEMIPYLSSSPHSTVEMQILATKLIALVLGDRGSTLYTTYQSLRTKRKHRYRIYIQGEPVPRILLLQRLYQQHLARVYRSHIEVCTTTDPLCCKLMSDLLDLATGAYDSVGNEACYALSQCIDRLCEPPDFLVSQTLKKLVEPPTKDNEEGGTLGAAVLLIDNSRLKYTILDNWQHVHDFIAALYQSNELDQKRTTKHLMRLLRTYSIALFVEPLHLPPFAAEVANNFSDIKTITLARQHLEQQLSRDIDTYRHIMDILSSPRSDHWRFEILSCLWFVLFLPWAPDKLPLPWIQWLAKGITSKFSDCLLLSTLGLLCMVRNCQYDDEDLLDSLDLEEFAHAVIESRMSISQEGNDAGLLDPTKENMEDFGSLLLGLTKYLSSSWPTLTGLVSDQFHAINAQLFKALVRRHGEQFLQMCVDLVITLENESEATDEEESRQCFIAEVVAGVIRARKSVKPDEWWVSHISSLLEAATPSAWPIWASCVQYIVRGRSLASINWLVEILRQALNELMSHCDGESFRAVVRHLNFLQSMVVETCEPAIFSALITENEINRCLLHPYKSIRLEAAFLLSQTLAVVCPFRARKRESETQNSEVLNTVLKVTRSLCDIVAQSPESDAATSLINLVYFSSQTGWINSFIPIFHELLIALFAIQAAPKQEVADLARDALILLANNTVPVDMQPLYSFSSIVSEVKQALTSDNWHRRRWVSLFASVLIANYAYTITNENALEYLKLTIEMLKDKQLEVHVTAAANISRCLSSGIPLSTDPALLKTLIDEFEEFSKNATLEIRHGGILGLAAILMSEPFIVPEHFPRVVGILMQHGLERPPLGNAVTECFRSFWKTHQCNWELFQDQFTEEQYQAIRGHLTPPWYYA
ncbi:proteasome activator subunit 4 [Pelomyxa schiedti]|nr:proteasome activator subunit 4 [Pelomyxa schiedti]